MKGYRVRQAANVPRDHRDRSKLPHRPRVAEDDAVEKSPLDVRKSDFPEGLPAVGAEGKSGFLFFGVFRLHGGRQFAGDERKRNKKRRQDNRRHGEENLDMTLFQPRAQPTLGPEKRHKKKPRHHRRNRKRQLDERRQETLPHKPKLRDRPRARHSEEEIQRHCRRRGQKRQPDGRERVRVAQRRHVGPHSLLKRLRPQSHQRQHQKQTEKSNRHPYQRPANPRRFGDEVVGPFHELSS